VAWSLPGRLLSRRLRAIGSSRGLGRRKSWIRNNRDHVLRTNKREDRRIVGSAAKKQPASQRALARRASLFRDSVACHVANGNDNLETEKISILKPPVPKKLYRGRCDAATRGCGSNPVTKIGSAVFLVDPIYPTTSQVPPIR
jgi:hypothetical protein